MSNKEIEIKKIYVNSKEQFEKLYNSNALTLLGLDDTEKNLYSFAKWIKNLSEISNPLNMYIIKGKQMNEQYGLSGKNKYQDDLADFFKLRDNSNVNKELLIIAKLSGLNKRISFHTARHTNATLLIYSGVNITTVQKLLGHKSVKTTQVYTNIMDITIVRDLEKSKNNRKVSYM